jgi:PAS domain S-box-containing protein
MKRNSGRTGKQGNSGGKAAVGLSVPSHRHVRASRRSLASKIDLMQEIKELRVQLAEAQDTIQAIREGQVDAVIVSGSKGEQVFSLAGAESVYRLIVETMNEAAFTVAFDGSILFANARFVQFLGRPEEEILAHTLYEFVPIDQCTAVESLLAASQKEPAKSRLVFRSSDGTLVPSLIASSLLDQAGGASLCMVATNLTELENSTHIIRKLHRQDKILQQKEERFRSVLDSSLDTIYRFNLKTRRYEYFSPASLSVYGYAPEEMMQMEEKQIFARVHPEDLPSLEENLKRMLTSGKAVIDFRWRKKSGEYRWLSAYTTLVRDDSGQPMYRDGVTRDITERKLAEEQLNLMLKKYSTMFDATSDGIWLHNLNCSILEVNDAYCRMSGYSRGELVGMPISALEAKESAAEVAEHISRLIESGGHERFESRHRRKDGSIFDADITAVHLGIEDDRIAIFIRDISEQKKLMNMLERTSREQQIILDSTRALIFYKDKENRLRRVNKAFEEVTGFKRKQAEGKSLYELYSKEYADAYWQDDLEVIKSRKAKRGILETTETTQGIKTVQTDKIPYFDEQGNVDGVIGFSIDVTDLKKTEETLRRTATRLQLLSNCASRLLSSEDPQSIVNDLCQEVMTHLDCQAFFNFLVDEKAGRLHLNACAGIPEEELRKIEWLDYGVAVCGCAAQQRCRIIAEDIMKVPDPRTELVKSYGIQAYCCHPLIAQGRIIGTLSFGTKNRARFAPDEVDVMHTVADQVSIAMQRVLGMQALKDLNESLEQRVAERTAEVQQQAERLHVLAAELSQAEQRERKRLATILHDHIQQLLVAAQMQLSFVKHTNGADMESAIQGVHSIIREAIDASRSLAMDLSPPILHQGGLAAALGWLANRMEEKNLFKIRVRVDSDAEPAAEPMRLLLFESVRELLLNVIKHSGAREARVSMVRTPDNWTQISIEDDGSGFDMEAGGARPSGLGLFGIQQRLTYMGGKFEIQSAPGHGTHVVLLAPLEKTQSQKPPSKIIAHETGEKLIVAPRRDDKKITILLVDDHWIVRQGLANLLHLEPDFEVVAEAESGEQALNLARHLKPDMVVTDVSLPGMDGVELTRTLRTEFPTTKVLGLSMHIEKDVAAAMRDAGAAGYLTKGGVFEDLIEAIRACMTPR